jgi:hypothetical protein
MKIILSLDLNEKDLEEDKSKEEIKEELKNMLFEVCEEWVLRGQEPDLEFEGGKEL